LSVTSAPQSPFPPLHVIYPIFPVLLGGVSGTTLNPLAARPCTGELDVCGAVGGRPKLGCFKLFNWPGCVVARLSNGLGDDMFPMLGRASRLTSADEVALLLLLPTFGVETGSVGERTGVFARLGYPS